MREDRLQKPKGRRWRLILLLTVLVGFIVAAGPWLVVSDPLRRADAIVVIGGDHKPARIAQGVALYHQGYASQVILSGGTMVLEGEARMPEAQVMLAQALALGLSEEVVLLETRSRSTWENARYVRQMCREMALDVILLVTSAYHSHRARRIFRQIMGEEIEVIARPAMLDTGAGLWWAHPDQAQVVLYEYWNWAGYGLTALERVDL